MHRVFPSFRSLLFCCAWLCMPVMFCVLACTSPSSGSDGGSEATPERQAEKKKYIPPDYPKDDELRLNHIQVKGTHNSYHIAPDTQAIQDWNYTHKPLEQQFSEQGVRQIELDLYWDKDKKKVQVYHLPVLDAKSTCPYFEQCLSTIKRWSDEKPDHLPIFVMLEAKQSESAAPKDFLDLIDKEVLAVFPKSRIITPNDVRGKSATLREAVEAKGWPTLRESRGKLVFVLLIDGARKEAYTSGGKHLKGKLMFVFAPFDSPYSAIMKIDGPSGKGTAEIQKAIKAGRLVRTRSDGGLVEPKKNDRSRLQAALTSGAHMISTDFPGQVEPYDYVVKIPGGTPARCNPITAPKGCTARDLESGKAED